MKIAVEYRGVTPNAMPDTPGRRWHIAVAITI